MSDKEPAGPASGCARPDRERYTWLWVLLIMLLALGVRLYRLNEQSVWGDEWPPLAHLNAPDAATSLQLLRMAFPEHMMSPLYYLLEYYFAQAFGTDPTTVRLFAVMQGLLSIPLIFLVGKYAFGRYAGLAAALCMALSPLHVWHSQEVRPYIMQVVVVLASMYSLLRALREKKSSWWIVHFAANGLLPWVHLFGTLYLFTEGCFLLVLWRKRFRRVMLWGLAHAVLLAPWAAWLSTTPYFKDEKVGAASIVEMLPLWLGEDIISTNTDLLPAWKTSPQQVSSPLSEMLRCRTGFDAVLMAVLILGIVWLAWRSLRWAWAIRAKRGAGGEPDPAPFLLLLVAILPHTLLLLIEAATRQPFYGPMYAMYHLSGVYVGVGGLIASVAWGVSRLTAAGRLRGCPSPWTAGAGLLLITVLYTYQLAIFLPEVTRSDWNGVRKYIQANGSQRDLAALFAWYGPWDTMRFNMVGTGIPTRRFNTFQAVCEDSARFLGQEPDENRSVWVVLEPVVMATVYPGFDPVAALEKGLSERGLRCTRKEFPGHYDLQVFRIQREPGTTTTTSGALVTEPAHPDYESVLRDLNLCFADEEAHQQAVAALRRSVFVWPPYIFFQDVSNAVDLIFRDENVLAEAMAQRTLRNRPWMSLAWFTAGLAAAQRGEDADALTKFEKAYALHPGLGCLLRPYTEALCKDHDYAKARSEVKKLDTWNLVLYLPAIDRICAMRESGQQVAVNAAPPSTRGTEAWRNRSKLAEALDIGESAPDWLVDSETYAFGQTDWESLAQSKVAFVTHCPVNREYFERCHGLGIRCFPYVTFYQGFATMTYEGVNLKDHPEFIEVDEQGNLKRMGFWTSEDAKNMYTTCPNVQAYQDAMVAWVRQVMELGADGVFVDNLSSRVPCFGPKYGRHQHICEDQNHAFALLLQRVREVIKEYQPEGAVLGNSANPPSLPKEFWKYLDAEMLESYICTWVSKDRWFDWKSHWNQTGKDLQPFVKAGKQIQALSYVGHTPYGVREDALFCYASARLAGFVWTGGSISNPDMADLYQLRLGKALTEEREEHGVHYRVFERGMVAVNPEKEKAASITLAEPIPTKRLFELAGAGAQHWAPCEQSAYAVDFEVKHSGSRAVRCSNAAADGANGVFQAVELNQETPGPIELSGWSKAQEVSGTADSNYALYADVQYSDGTWLYGQAAPFGVGTHDWERASLTIQPEKPVKHVTLHALFRNKAGLVWFDDITLYELERAELLQNGGFEEANRDGRIIDASATGAIEVPAFSGRVYLFGADTSSALGKSGPKLTVLTEPALGEVRFRVDGFDYWTHSGSWTTEYVLGPNFGKFHITFEQPGKHAIEVVDQVPADMSTPSGYGSGERLGQFMDPSNPTQPSAGKKFRFHGWAGSDNTGVLEVDVSQDTTIQAQFDVQPAS